MTYYSLIQLCKHFGANVIGTTSSAEKAELARANGADHVLLTTDSSGDNVKKVMELSGKGRYGWSCKLTAKLDALLTPPSRRARSVRRGGRSDVGGGL